jgi:transcription elongation factor GreA
MSILETRRLDEILSLDTAPARHCTADDRRAIRSLFDAAEDETALAELGVASAKALSHYGDNLRARYAMALYQELHGHADEAGAGFHQLAREVMKAEDWHAARELCLRALPLRPDHRTVRLLLEVWQHMPGEPGLEEDLAASREFCPDAPDLAMMGVARAEAEGRVAEADELACEALERFIAVREADRAEEPLLRLLEREQPATHRHLLRLLPRMASADMRELLDMTLDLGDESFRALQLHGELARILERIMLKRKGFDHLRDAYVRALTASLGGAPAAEAFIRDCGLADPASPLEDALAHFREMFSLRPGAYVQHHNLGVGRICAHDGHFLVIDFSEKPGHRMALEIARRSLRPLPDSCLRVARFSQPEVIAQELADDPVGLLVRALSDLGGEGSAREIRDCLAGDTVPEMDWSTWWKRAREAAHGDARVDTSQAFRQVYRLPGEEDEDVDLPDLPDRAGPQSVATMVDRLLRQHPELEERARARYAEALAQRTRSTVPLQDGVAAVPLLMRWLPEAAVEWRAVSQSAFHREPGVAAGINAEQQDYLLSIGLAGDSWYDAALSALGSRFPQVRDKALAAMRERLGAEFHGTLRELIVSRDWWLNARLSLVRLGLAGTLDDAGLTPWDLLVGALQVLAADPVQKLRYAALELLDPQERLGALLAASTPGDEDVALLTRTARDLISSETGLEPLAVLMSSSGHGEVIERLLREADEARRDPVSVHFDSSVTLMSRVTYDQNLHKMHELQNLLSNVLPAEIAAARSLGDLSENAEYHAARERQGIADATLRSLRSQMETARVIEEMAFPDGTVVAGTEVVVRDLAGGAERVIWILGQGDSTQDTHVINYKAPLGQALVGRRPGQVAEMDTADGVQRLEILAVTRRLPV